jgi:hypothetical protein
MKRETVRLIARLSKRLKLTQGRIIDRAVYCMAFNNGIAGIDVDWKQESKKRGWSKELRDYLSHSVRNG